MGVWVEFCVVCGGPPYVCFEGMADKDGRPLPNPPNAEDYKWLEDFLGVTDKEELIKLAAYDAYGNFDTQANESHSSVEVGCRDERDRETDPHGYACHVKCHTLLQKELGYALRYQDMRPLHIVGDWAALNKFPWTDYGGLAQYHGQMLEENQLVKDGKLWMLEDPSENEANKQRILKLWTPLVQNGFPVPEGLQAAADRNWPESAETVVATGGGSVDVDRC